MNRLFLHFFRFATMVVGMLLLSEMLFIFMCLQPGGYTLEHVSHCAWVTPIFLVWLGLSYLAIRLTPVVILAFIGTGFLAWRDSRRA
jgi:hypothetical protein